MRAAARLTPGCRNPVEVELRARSRQPGLAGSATLPPALRVGPARRLGRGCPPSSRKGPAPVASGACAPRSRLRPAPGNPEKTCPLVPGGSLTGCGGGVPLSSTARGPCNPGGYPCPALRRDLAPVPGKHPPFVSGAMAPGILGTNLPPSPRKPRARQDVPVRLARRRRASRRGRGAASGGGLSCASVRVVHQREPQPRPRWHGEPSVPVLRMLGKASA